MTNNSNNFKDTFTIQIVSRKPLNISFLKSSDKDWLDDITFAFKSILNDILSQDEYAYILNTNDLFEVKKSENDFKIVIIYDIKLNQSFIKEFNEQYDFDIEIFIKNMFVKVVQILNTKLEPSDTYKEYIVVPNKKYLLNILNLIKNYMYILKTYPFHLNQYHLKQYAL